MKKRKYTIIYDPETYSHFKNLDKKYWTVIKDKIEEQLLNNPDTVTTNKKPLSKPPIDNQWELRFGPNNIFRVFYYINEDKMEVWIIAIGKKIKEKLYIGNKVIKL